MRYSSGAKGEDGKPLVRKYDYAATAAASLAYLTLQQSDAVGLVTYDDAVRQLVRPTSQPSHLKQIVNVLNQGPGPRRTGPGAPPAGDPGPTGRRSPSAGEVARDGRDAARPAAPRACGGRPAASMP